MATSLITHTHTHALIPLPPCLFISPLGSTSGTPSASHLLLLLIFPLCVFIFLFLHFLSPSSSLSLSRTSPHVLFASLSLCLFPLLSRFVLTSDFSLFLYLYISSSALPPSPGSSPSPSRWQVPLSCFSRLACSPPDGWPHANINLL